MINRRQLFHAAAAAVLVMAAAASCSLEYMDSYFDPEEVFADEGPEVFCASGTVYSVESEPPRPIRGIRVIMTSYLESDRSKVQPQARDTAYTDDFGRYMTKLAIRGGEYYDLVAEDVDGEDNGGLFEKGFFDKLWPGGMNWLDNQDFYLQILLSL